MQLAEYQTKYLNELYNGLIQGNSSLILFTGYQGCGKSTIIEELADFLKDSWKIFLLTGAGKASPPYYTWYAAAQKSSALTRKRLSDISFGISFQPIGLPMGFVFSAGITSDEIIFNNNRSYCSGIFFNFSVDSASITFSIANPLSISG